MRSKDELRHIRHFIWDFDGTLFDSYPVIIQDLRAALAEYGRDADPVEAMRLMLDTIPAASRHYAAAYGIDPDALWTAYHRQHRQSHAALAVQPMAGAQALLRRIQATGGQNYIFTHRRLDETQAYLAKYGLTQLFCDIVAPETPGFAPKPAPDAVDYLLQKYHIPKETAAMVGDRSIDLGSGRAAGIAAIHLVCAVAPEDLECDWRFETLDEITALL